MRMMMATVFVTGLSMAAVAMAQAPPPAGGPQAGDAAPAFSLPGSDGPRTRWQTSRARKPWCWPGSPSLTGG